MRDDKIIVNSTGLSFYAGMVKRSDAEGRIKARVAISTAVRLRCSDWNHFQTEYAGNISESGIFITTDQPLSPGTLFTLEVTVGGERILAKAQVSWTKEFSTGQKKPSGMGARFVEMDIQSQTVLQNWLKDLSA